MTWTRALAYVGVWLALSAIYFAGFAGPGGRGTQADVDTRVAAAAAPTRAPEPETPSRQASYLSVKPEQVVEVEVSSGKRRVRAVRDGERWRIAEPPGVSVSSDLISALIAGVLGATAVQVVSVDDTRDAEFGLDVPTTRVRFATEDKSGVDLVLGKENPAQTGVYGRAAGSPEIVLVGLNARYYIDMVLNAAG